MMDQNQPPTLWFDQGITFSSSLTCDFAFGHYGKWLDQREDGLRTIDLIRGLKVEIESEREIMMRTGKEKCELMWERCRERERERVCVRERERGSVRVRERERECVWERERERERERESVCESEREIMMRTGKEKYELMWERCRERECVRERERERVCVRERERGSVCVRERERVCVRERERVCVREREREIQERLQKWQSVKDPQTNIRKMYQLKLVFHFIKYCAIVFRLGLSWSMAQFIFSSSE